MTTERMLMTVLNQRLTSPLRFEIISTDQTQAIGQIDLSKLADSVASQLRVLPTAGS
jgi:hypothetical protein